jgi:hypothetical protein
VTEINDGWHALRVPCQDCGCTVGRLRLVGGQYTVRCADCDRFAFNAPRAELGLPSEAPKAVVITSKYPGSCKVCGERHVSGERVAWVPKTKGVSCLKCHGGEQ